MTPARLTCERVDGPARAGGGQTPRGTFYHPLLHAGRHPRRGAPARRRRSGRARPAGRAGQHLPPDAAARGRGGRGARRPAPLHGLERPPPHRLRRLPGLLPGPAESTTTASRSVRPTTAPPPPDPGSGGGHPGGARRRHPDGPRHLLRPAGARGGDPAGREAHPGLGGPGPGRPPTPGPVPVRDRPGRGRHRPAGRGRGARPPPSSSTATASAGCRSASRGEQMLPALAAALAELPVDRPRYLMGVGDPVIVARGRGARGGHVRLRAADPAGPPRHRPDRRRALPGAGGAGHATDDGPLDPACPCRVCARFSRGYLRHLLVVGEPTGGRLLTIHNLSWLLGAGRPGPGGHPDRHPRPRCEPRWLPSGNRGRCAKVSRSLPRGGAPSLPCTRPPHPAAASTTTTTHSSKKSSASSYTLLFIIVFFAAPSTSCSSGPASSGCASSRPQAREMSVGDEVVTAGGIHGRVVALDADVAEVEVAPGVVLTFLRRPISRPADRPAANPGPPSPRAVERGSAGTSRRATPARADGQLRRRRGRTTQPDQQPDMRRGLVWSSGRHHRRSLR